MDNASGTTQSSPDAHTQVQSRRQITTRADRPCDTCRKRKSKCAKDPGQQRCVLCAFHDRDCTYQDAPAPRRKREQEDTPASTDSSEIRPRKKSKTIHIPDPPLDTTPPSVEPPTRSLLDRTLGLHQTTHFKYIGPSSPHEQKLLDILHRFQDPGSGEDEFKFRRVTANTTFLSKSDHQTPLGADIDNDLHAVEQLVHPHGPGLVGLYFRTVHPSYPVLHKAVFLEKYARSYTEFSPPLLAAVYLLAMDWWEFDRELSSKTNPDAVALSRLATKALGDVIHRPKLSSVQAGLLLLQRSGGDSWVLTSQVLAIGEELGLHLDCSTWDIPSWEKGLRRRLAWALFMQDKWGSLIHGRPSHILYHSPSSSVWQLPELTLSDFSESMAEEGSAEVEKGKQLFIHLAKLTLIMTQALETLYHPTSPVATVLSQAGVQGLLDLIKPLALSLKNWASSLPKELHINILPPRKLCSNGYLHLSYFVTEIIIHRLIIRNLSLPSTSASLVSLCREAGKARLERAIAFVEGLKPEHLQAFWWFAAPKSLAYIRTYGGLLWATSSTEKEAGYYRGMLGDFRWSLKVRAKGVGFVTAALREMEESLREIDMSRDILSISSSRGGLVRDGEGEGDGDGGAVAVVGRQVGGGYEGYFGDSSVGFEETAAGFELLDVDVRVAASGSAQGGYQDGQIVEDDGYFFAAGMVDLL
ncbi:fungal-specific transcription factor domain-containing protein [Podospora australis]|uniref:Fungal-specific transcription factor domain-containing protein n=1 Tax=Podospora australis TaxID=1536484 RepID=A0AAN6WPJ4_9PEZI|nr:fungal-specific transcription factor domain-containing protein [Podospora australis]